MPYFVDPDREFAALAVGVVEQSVLAATNIKGEDAFLIVLQNMSAVETFTGAASASPDGVNQWAVELNDEFASIGPGVTRRMLIPADRLWVRVTGNFVGAPDTLRMSTVRLRQAVRRG